MNNITLKLGLSSLIFLLSSCLATHTGSITNSVSITNGNVTYVKEDVEGIAIVNYVLFVGGHKKHTLVTDAKKDLKAKFPLSKNQGYANMVVNFKTTFILGIIGVTRCTVSADIVEFN